MTLPDQSLLAELVAAAILAALTVLLYRLGGKRTIAKRPLAYKDSSGQTRIIVGGSEFALADIPPAQRTLWKQNKDYVVHHGRYLRGLIVGDDKRWSTSKIQALLWTYAILFGLLSLILALGFGDASGFNQEKARGLQEQYLVLLGGPFAAAVLSKYITASKVEEGGNKAALTTSSLDPRHGIAEVVSDDSGRGDLGDAQYFAFTLIALAYFYVAFCPHLHEGLPDLPNLLVGLTSLSAATYVAKKASENEKPSLTSVVPDQGKFGDKVHVWGQYLVVSSPVDPPVAEWEPRATIGGLIASVEVLSDGRAATDHLRIEVPKVDVSKGPNETSLRVYTSVGTAAGDLRFTVVP
jgi:hypothetical protein